MQQQDQQIQRVTLLLNQAKAGDNKALNQLVNLVYQDLKQIARGQRQKIISNTINTTGLVHEAWIKIQNKGLSFNNKNHFMAVAALAMRHLLINRAQKKQAQKRKCNKPDTYSSEVHGQHFTEEWLLDLDSGLEQLKTYNPRLEQVFQMMYFVGLSEKEVAQYLQISERTVRRDWVKAKLMLAAHLA